MVLLVKKFSNGLSLGRGGMHLVDLSARLSLAPVLHLALHGPGSAHISVATLVLSTLIPSNVFIIHKLH